MPKSAISLFSLILFFLPLYSQDDPGLSGLWQAEQVMVGDRDMTPPARWARFGADGSYEGGNGWLKHEEGVWNYQPAEQSLSLEVTQGIIDEAPPFRLSFIEEGMVWEREEEGMPVVVNWKRIEALPQGVSDRAYGLWQLIDSRGEEGVEADGRRFLHLRWDGVFVEGHTPEGRITGYYRINPKDPYLILMFHDQAGNGEAGTWNSRLQVRWC